VKALGRLAAEYVLGIVAAAVMLPALAALITSLLVLGQSSWTGVLNDNASRTCLYGTGIAVVAWLLLGLLCRRFARVDGAQPGTYGELVEAFARLHARVQAAGASGTRSAAVDLAVAEATEQCAFVRSKLVDRPQPIGAEWLLANGYVDLWKRIHRTEEALLMIEPEPDLLRDGLHDDARLHNSRIAGGDLLLRRLGGAIAMISPRVAAFLSDDARRGIPPVNAGAAGAGGTATETGAAATGDLSAGTAPPPGPPASGAVSDEARSLLRQVRLAINEYRDSRREGLVRARNNLYATVVFTGLTGYVLLVIAIIAGAKPKQIVAAASFYLVGGLVGLCRELSRASSDTTLQDDFGFGVARLIHTPLFSGLAAVGGVVLTSIFPALIPPSGSATGAAGTSTHQILDLTQIFDLSRNQGGFVIAAVFGLSPNLLLSRLQRQVEQFKTDLKSSETGESGGQAGGG